VTGTVRPQSPNFARRVHDSFARRQVMTTRGADCGAELTEVGPGAVTIELAFRQALIQQQGFLHAGVVITVLDAAWRHTAHGLLAASAVPLAAHRGAFQGNADQTGIHQRPPTRPQLPRNPPPARFRPAIPGHRRVPAGPLANPLPTPAGRLQNEVDFAQEKSTR